MQVLVSVTARGCVDGADQVGGDGWMRFSDRRSPTKLGYALLSLKDFLTLHFPLFSRNSSHMRGAAHLPLFSDLVGIRD